MATNEIGSKHNMKYEWRANLNGADAAELHGKGQLLYQKSKHLAHTFLAGIAQTPDYGTADEHHVSTQCQCLYTVQNWRRDKGDKCIR